MNTTSDEQQCMTHYSVSLFNIIYQIHPMHHLAELRFAAIS